MHIAIAGNIGSGKTTLTRMLSNYYGWVPRYESVDFNPYLDDYYKDIPRWSFAMPAYGKTMLPLVVAMFAAEWLTRRYDHPLQAVAQWRTSSLRLATYFALAAAILYHAGSDVQFIYFQF